ncbi:MAG TPA: DUF1425 domain-containing protein [Desulfomonilia bacterium]|nr:DUF1425 domain-containing protein [Desulfomonilia bacterium]
MRKLGRSFLILTFFAVACAGTAPNILHVQAGPMGVSSKQVEINDKYLERNLSFGDVAIKPLDGADLFEAQVILKNESSNDLSFEYRFIWYDARGYEVSNVSSWIPAALGGKESKGFRSAAPGPNAAGFRLMVRNPHPVTSTGS